MRGRGVLLLPSFALGFVCLPDLRVDPVEKDLTHFQIAKVKPADSGCSLASRISWITVLLTGLSGVCGFAAPSYAAGTSYYINNQPGSNCSDGGAHTVAQPWCTFGPANRIKSFTAGDQILLARGGSWNQELSLAGRGTLSEPVTLGAYGTGAKPKILRNQAVDDICVLVTDASDWKISDLEVGGQAWASSCTSRSSSTAESRSPTLMRTTIGEYGPAIRPNIRYRIM
jgi:hypothetical protein